jgi:hypothetical protein
MAPSKQSLLPLGLFMKNPKPSTKKKHTKLERSALGLPTSYEKKPYVDKKREQRIKEEKRIAEGAEQWRRHLEMSGVPNPESIRLDILYLSNGPAPTSALSQDDDESV